MLSSLLQIKMHWVCANYWKAGPDGNDIHKTNVPNLRMRFRYDCHTDELNLVMSGADSRMEKQVIRWPHASVWEDFRGERASRLLAGLLL